MKISNQLNKLAGLITLGSIGACAPIMPRPFVPLTEPPEAVTKAEFETAFQTCVAETTNGTGNIAYNKNEGTAAGIATTAVAGTGAVAATSMLTTVGAGAGSLGMGVILAPVAYGYGVSRGVAVIKRNGKEHKIQQSLETCMAKSDYKIISWRKIEPADNVNIVTPIAKPK